MQPRVKVLLPAFILLLITVAFGGGGGIRFDSEGDKERELNILRTQLKKPLDPECIKERARYFYRTYDGSCNWLVQGESTWGMAGTALTRDWGQVSYKDGISEPRDGPNPRELSNIFFSRDKKPSEMEYKHTPILLALVEFVIHDIVTTTRSRSESMVFEVPKCDKAFDPDCHGNQTLHMWRTTPVPGTGTSHDNPRESMNAGSAWIDLSPIYGNTKEVCDKLRSFQGGKLKTQKGADGGDYPPFNTMGLPMNGFGNLEDMLAGGDARTNQDWPLLAVHTLLVRNHNRLADSIAEEHPDWDEEKLFQYARHLNIAQYTITLNSYQMAYFKEDIRPPRDDGMPLYREWHQKSVWEINPLYTYPFHLTLVNGKPMVTSQELALGYRFHDFIPELFSTIDENGQILKTMKLAETSFDGRGFFNVGIDPVLRGMASATMPYFHSGMSEDFRSAKYSYAVPQEGGKYPHHGYSSQSKSSPPPLNHYMGAGYDMAAATIIQERERGIPTFNDYFRNYTGKVPVKIRKTFEEFTSDPKLVAELKRLYKHPDDVDLIVGMQLETDLFPGTTVPLGFLISSLYSLFGIGSSDRFSVAYSGTLCLLTGKPWDCTPLNPLDEMLWKPVPIPFFPRARWFDPKWFDETDLTNKGIYGVWNLITKNSNIKCLQKDPLFPPDEKTNPVICSLPKETSSWPYLGYGFILVLVACFGWYISRRGSNRTPKPMQLRKPKKD